MVTVNIPELVKEASAMTTKMVKGYEVLSHIDEIDVGTAPKELVYQDGRVKLYHYRNPKKPSNQTPVLIAYALINKQYMLDLEPDRSLVRNLLSEGVDLYIIDWGYVTRGDRYDSVEDYVNGYLDGCVEFIRRSTEKKQINLAGVCQGGTLCTMYAALYPEKIKNLITIVTPIDFSTNDGLLFRWSRYMDIDTIVDSYGTIPGDFLNAGFALLKPMQKIDKYLHLLDVIDNHDKTMNFLRMEYWILDSPDQAGECYRQFLIDLYKHNKLVKGTFKVGNQTVDLKKVTMPLLNIYAKQDHIVPPAASKPLNQLVGSKDTKLYEFEGGHIGVFVSSKTQKELAPAISNWLHERDK